MTAMGAQTTGRECDPSFPLPLPRCLTRCLHRDYFPYSIPCPMGKRRGWVHWPGQRRRAGPESRPALAPPLSHAPPGRVAPIAPVLAVISLFLSELAPGRVPLPGRPPRSAVIARAPGSSGPRPRASIRVSAHDRPNLSETNGRGSIRFRPTGRRATEPAPALSLLTWWQNHVNIIASHTGRLVSCPPSWFPSRLIPPPPFPSSAHPM